MILQILAPGLLMGGSDAGQLYAGLPIVCTTGQYVSALATTGQYVSQFSTTGQYVTALATDGSIGVC